MSEPKFVPKTVYVTYIASTPEKVWAALTSAEFTTQYFFGRSVEIEHKVGGDFTMRMPDGRFDIKGRVVEWDPPRRLTVTWGVAFEEFRELPESLVTYDIEPMGGKRQAHDDGGPPMGRPRRHPRRRAPGLAVDPVEPQERAGDRQADRDQREDGTAQGDAGGGQGGVCNETLARCGSGAVAGYRRLALIFSSAAEPGQSSFSASELSGASTVLKWRCRSSGSRST